MIKKPPNPANSDWVPASKGLPKEAPDYLRTELLEMGMHEDIIQPYWEAVLESQKPGSKMPRPDLDEWLHTKPADIIPLHRPQESGPSGTE